MQKTGTLADTKTTIAGAYYQRVTGASGFTFAELGRQVAEQAAALEREHQQCRETEQEALAIESARKAAELASWEVGQRAAGKRVTLRQLAEQHGFAPRYLSNVKRAYDARGGWGSKVHKSYG